MQNIKFDQLADDTRIQSIGNFFRKDNESTWGINLGFNPNQKTSALKISNAPVLVRKRTLNPTNLNQPAGWRLSFSIQDTLDWEVKKLGEYPVADKIMTNEKEQLCFFFKIASGTSIYLPQFELARVLFLHNAYLSRTALEPDNLKAEFDIIIDDEFEEARINVLLPSGYPRKSLDDYQSRRLLSWILIDKEARASFESIGLHQKLYGINNNGYRRWNFQFEPPPLHSAEFIMRGWNDINSKSFFVYEISAIRNISVNIPDVVEIYHPLFTETIGVKGSGGGGMGSGVQNDDYEIQEGESANSDHPHRIIQAPVVEFEFAKPFKTVKVAKKEQKRASGYATEKSQEVASKEVSIEEPTRTGQQPSADWNIVSDVTEDAHLYANKFKCFKKMLDQLVSQHGCTINSQQFRKLPHLARCKKHLLTDGNHRCISVIEILVERTTFHILEVDTSDAINSLSTQILLLSSPLDWEKQLVALERELLKKSLVWPSHLFTKFCVEGRYKGVAHPKSSVSCKGLLDTDSVIHWADRFFGLMKTML
jgi:hypothetical protein